MAIATLLTESLLAHGGQARGPGTNAAVGRGLLVLASSHGLGLFGPLEGETRLAGWLDGWRDGRTVCSKGSSEPLVFLSVILTILFTHSFLHYRISCQS